MSTEVSRCWARHSSRAALVLGGLVLALARPAGAQGIGLEQLLHTMDWGTGSLLLLDKLEYAPQATGGPLILDASGWYGGAYSRLWFRAEGEQLTDESDGDGEAQLFYGRLITPYWDALAGVRVDGRWGGESGVRAHVAVGLTGLAPLRFEFSPTLFLSQHGDLSGRLEAEYQILVTQRLVAEPEIELNAALQDVPEWGVGSGINDYEVGLRLRYEIRREFAPYVGYSWTRRVGASADLARETGGDASGGSFTVGLRMWR